MTDEAWVDWSERWGPSTATRPDTVTVDVHSHLKVPESSDMAMPHLTPEDDPRTLFSSEESKALNHGFHESVDDKFTDPATRIADMDAMGIDLQMLALAPPQYFYTLEEEIATKVAVTQNDRIAAVVDDYPKRFAGVGSLPMRHADRAVAEAQRIHGLGFRAVQIGADVAGIDLDDPSFDPIWSTLADLGIVPILHPAGFTDGARLTEYYLVNVIGMPLSSTVALTRMILGGVFARHQDLRLLVVHGGGYLPFYVARTDHAFRHRPELRHHIDRPPSEYLDQVYFDTTVFAPPMVESLVERYGADHVLMGTDYPFDMGQGDPIAFLGGTNLTGEDLRLVMGQNAVRMFDLDVGRDDATG